MISNLSKWYQFDFSTKEIDIWTFENPAIFTKCRQPRLASCWLCLCTCSNNDIVRPPGTAIPDGLMFCRRCFFRQPHLRGPSSDRRETLPLWLESPNKVGQLGGPPLKKISGQKRAKFRSIFCNVRLWPRISPEWLKISNPKRDVFYIDSPCVQRNRPRELWSTNSKDLAVRLDPLKCTFWGYYISAFRGCCALKFLHAL